jgi:hypothetical protein
MGDGPGDPKFAAPPGRIMSYNGTSGIMAESLLSRITEDIQEQIKGLWN